MYIYLFIYIFGGGEQRWYPLPIHHRPTQPAQCSLNVLKGNYFPPERFSKADGRNACTLYALVAAWNHSEPIGDTGLLPERLLATEGEVMEELLVCAVPMHVVTAEHQTNKGVDEPLTSSEDLLQFASDPDLPAGGQAHCAPYGKAARTVCATAKETTGV